jgi:hypothetical protein
MSEVAVKLPPTRSKPDSSPPQRAESVTPRASTPAPVAPATPEPDPVASLGSLYADQASPTAETWVGTTAISRTPNTRRLVGMMILPTILLAVTGVFVAGYFAFDGQGGKKREAAPPVAASLATKPTDVEPVALAAPAAAAPAALPTEAAPSEPAPTTLAGTAPMTAEATAPSIATTDPSSAKVVAKTFIDVRIDSTPSGATVTLIDHGKSTFLGTTPIVTSVDPSRTYDVVFEHGDRTQREHLDPRTTSRLEIALGKDTVEETPKAKTETVEKQVAVVTPAKPEPPKAAPKTKAEAPKAEKAVAAPAPRGDGVLMISSKPPCEIYVDGKATGLMTPQRSIPLAAGKHKITLVSPDKTIKKTVAVDIVADKPTKVIQDLMAE